MHWEQLGDVLDRPEQLPLSGVGVSFFVGIHLSPQGQRTVFLERRNDDVAQVASVSLPAGAPDMTLKVAGAGARYRFYYRGRTEDWMQIGGDQDGTILSAKKAGGFVGNTLGYWLGLALFPMQSFREPQFSGLYCLVVIEEILLKGINRREFVATTVAAGARFSPPEMRLAFRGEALNKPPCPLTRQTARFCGSRQFRFRWRRGLRPVHSVRRLMRIVGILKPCLLTGCSHVPP